jgi:integrase
MAARATANRPTRPGSGASGTARRSAAAGPGPDGGPFRTLAEAKSWRADAVGSARRGELRASTRLTLREAWEAWLAGARDGTIRTRSGDRYKPSPIRSYETAMRLRMLDDLGAVKLSEISRVELQDLADRLLAQGLDPSTIRNTFMPLRAIFRRAVSRGELTVNPTTGLELPAVRGTRDRIATPTEAAAILDAVPAADRAIWATAAYAGLRAAELQALRHDDVDLEHGLIHVRRSWDPRVGEIPPKSRAGTRTVPIVAALRAHLAAHLLAQRRRSGLLFGRTESRPFDPRALALRADAAWKATGLDRITLHELRHTCASIFIAAGVNAKTLAAFMGHASVTITLDRYGHLFPGSEDEAAALVDAYLERATGAQTGAQTAEAASLSHS